MSTHVRYSLFLFLSTALFVMTAGMKFLSARKIQMIGSALLCVSYIISSRAENVQLLLFSHGVVQGRTSMVII